MRDAAMVADGRSSSRCAGRVPRLAILATHPIQYHAPWYRGLVADGRLQIKVFFCHQPTPQQQASAGFGVAFDWDVPLLDGYEHEFLTNVAANPRTSGFDGLDVPGIREILRAGEFDAVLVNGWNYKAAWQTTWASKRLNVPVLMRGDSHLHTPRSRVKNCFKRLTYPLMLRSFDGFLDVGQWSREYYLHYGAREDRVFFVPHVIDELGFLNSMQKLHAQRDSIREMWDLPSDATVFLFAGKFIGKKNPLDFLRALKIAASTGTRVAGLMVGDGPLRPTCEEFARLEELPVTFAGFLNQSQIVKAYTAADCLILPSDGGETWGVVVNEAMWSGLPCIVSDRVGCGPDLIAALGTGAVFPLHDENRLGEYMVHLARNPEQRDACGVRARMLIQSYSVAAAVEGTVNAVAAVKKRGRA